MSLKDSLTNELKRKLTPVEEMNIISDKIYRQLLGDDYEKTCRHWDYLAENGRIAEIIGDRRYREGQSLILQHLMPPAEEYADDD